MSRGEATRRDRRTDRASLAYERLRALTRQDAGEIFGIVGPLEGMAAMTAARKDAGERSNLVTTCWPPRGG